MEEGSPYWTSGHPNHKRAVEEVPKMKLITIATLIDKLKLNGY